MKEIYEQIIYIYFDLALKGINLISIALTIILIDYIKSHIFINFAFYSEKNKNWINLLAGLLLSYIFSVIFFLAGQLNGLTLSTVIGFSCSVASQNIMKAVYKFFDKGA